MPAVSLGRALADQNLFARHFRGPSWASWKVFLAALFAEAPDEAALAVYRERTGRTAWPTAPFTEAAVIVGRRGGKSRTLGVIAVYLAAFSQTTRSIWRRVRWRRSGCWRNDKGQARAIFRFVSDSLKAVPMLALR